MAAYKYYRDPIDEHSVLREIADSPAFHYEMRDYNDPCFQTINTEPFEKMRSSTAAAPQNESVGESETPRTIRIGSPKGVRGRRGSVYRRRIS